MTPVARNYGVWAIRRAHVPFCWWVLTGNVQFWRYIRLSEDSDSLTMWDIRA